MTGDAFRKGDLIIRNLRPLGGAATDIEIRAGRIAAIGRIAQTNAPVEDAGGAIAIPALVEAHTHMDKTLWGLPWRPHQAGPRLIDKIENERAYRRDNAFDPAPASRTQALRQLALGATAIRSHVDVDTEIGTRHVEGVAATREALRGLIDIEIVAFPQSGMLIRPGTAELMDAALAGEADVVGGLDPSAIDRDPVKHLDVVFGLAEKHGKPVDIHLHEPGELGAFAMDLIIERTRALGMQGKVVVSHGFCLAMVDEARLGGLIEGLAEAGIAVMTTAPANRDLPPVKRLREGGVVVCGGSDGVRDTWGPYGNGDMLERAMLIAWRSGFRRDDEIEMCLDVCCAGGAAALGLADYGLTLGGRGDMVLLRAEAVAQAVVERAPRQAVIRAGRVVAREGRVLEG